MSRGQSAEGSAVCERLGAPHALQAEAQLGPSLGQPLHARPVEVALGNTLP